MQLSLELPAEIATTARTINSRRSVRPFKSQLLKWIGNKQRFAHEIISFFPERFGAYLLDTCTH